ncbi:unnamed protein product [Schistosoma mattheei]|uniref:Uncharacterized protein n=1 Tax=Schistosoma mattheei TaxID=31246 RepID=A0A183PZ00_9TREM|nr:unnamed protein product [Schistosoma mattheei]
MSNVQDYDLTLATNDPTSSNTLTLWCLRSLTNFLTSNPNTLIFDRKMSASEACKKSLVTLESYLRDEHTNSETLKFSANSVLTVDGKKPSPLEEVEILDTIATYIMLKNEEDVKYRLFFEVFPADKDISTDCLYFLIKLSSLAICLGLSPVLEIVSLWLKVSEISIFECCEDIFLSIYSQTL